MKTPSDYRELSGSEAATLLAALRTFQRDYAAQVYNGYGHFDDYGPLSMEEIDVLCRSINSGNVIIREQQ